MLILYKNLFIIQNKHKIVLAIAQELDIELRQIQEKIS